MPGRRRARTPPHVYCLHVPLAAAAQHPCVAAALLETLIKHLAYDREQCHHTFQQLDAFAAHHKQLQQQQQPQHQPLHPHVPLSHPAPQQLLAKQRRTRLDAASRRALKYHARLSGLLQLAAAIPFHQLGGMTVAVLLGGSVQRPREVYCLHLPAVMHTPGGRGVPPPPSAASVSAAARKLVLTLLSQHQHIEEWKAAPGPTKMWLLFQAPDGSLQSAPPGFAAKRSLGASGLSLRRAFQVDIHMAAAGGGGAGGGQQQQQQQQQLEQLEQQLSQQLSLRMNLTDTAAAAAAAAAAPPAAPPAAVWYQAVTHVKGLRPPNQNQSDA